MSVVSGSRARLLTVAVVGVLALAASVFAGNTANASTTATQMVITGITGPDSIAVPSDLPGGAAPTVVVEAGPASDPLSRFTVHVSFEDSTGTLAPLANSATTITLTSTGGPLSPATYVVPGGATSADITTGLATPANQVSITLSAGKGGKAIHTSSSTDQLFDVLKAVKTAGADQTTGSSSLGIGGDTDCANATPASPVCGILMLPFGAPTGALVSLGACDSTYAKCGSTKGAVVQALADLPPGQYTRTSPATLLIKCDKSLCGGGAIQKIHLSYSLSGSGRLDQTAAACPAKNTLAADGSPCVDYVQSKRDGSGDTHLYLLFDQDMRGSLS